MELYGGKANVLADDLRRWFLGLWHGKSLALIIAVSATIMSLGLFYVANYLIPLQESDTRPGRPPQEND